jgi:hypothetical protein
MQRAPCRDVVVVVPGILGSQLAVDGRLVWGLSGAALWQGLKTLGGSMRRLRLPADLGDGHPGDGVRPVGLMSGLHLVPGLWSPVEGYAGLVRWLEQNFTLLRYDPTRPQEPANLVEFPYDWRLSNRFTACRLRELVVPVLDRWQASAPERRDAKLVLICHSMGGLVARHFLAVLGGAELTGKLLTLGTPYRGSVKALGQLVNGSRIPGLTALARSLPSLYQLLPVYDSVGTGAELRHHRELSWPAGVDTGLVSDAELFHAQIANGVRRLGQPGYGTRAVTGLRQPTPTTAVVEGDRLRLVREIRGEDEGGDATVPRLSARPPEMAADDPALRGPHDTHGALPGNRSVREAIWEWLAPPGAYHRAPDDGGGWLGVDVPELVPAGMPWPVAVTGSSDTLRVTVAVAPAEGEHGPPRPLRNLGAGRYTGEGPPLPPGAYVVRASAPGAAPVTAFVVAGAEELA